MAEQYNSKLTKDVTTLRKDVDVLRKDVDVLKIDVAVIKRTMATKDDLKNFATKDDLKSLATKDSVDRLASAVFKLQGDLVQTRDELNNKIEHFANKILDRIDYFSGQFLDYSRKAIFQGHRIEELEPKVKDHEVRIAALEAAKNL